jgi:hypothetical protein
VYTYRLWRSTEKLWEAGEKQLTVSTSSANAVMQANKISVNSLIADQRAWIDVDGLKIEQPVLNNDMLLSRVIASVKIENIGKTPALNVVTKIKITTDFIKDKMSLLVNNCTLEYGEYNSKLLPPRKYYRRKWGLIIANSEDPLIGIPTIYGVVTYKISIDKSVHQTGFVFQLFECHPNRPQDFKTLLKFLHKPLPIERIGWDASSGGFAD